MAELILDELKLNSDGFAKFRDQGKDPLEFRHLDPGCGTGTFLVLLISRLKQYVESTGLDKRSALRKILSNVVGFDIDGLAVLTARTNYLIALGDLLEPISILQNLDKFRRVSDVIVECLELGVDPQLLEFRLESRLKPWIGWRATSASARGAS